MKFPGELGCYFYDKKKNKWRGNIGMGLGTVQSVKRKHFWADTEDALIKKFLAWRDSEDGQTFLTARTQNPLSPHYIEPIEFPALIDKLQKVCKHHGYDFKKVVQAFVNLGIMEEKE